MKARAATCLLVVLAACDLPQPPWSEPPALPLDLKVEVTPHEVGLLEPLTVLLDLYRRADVEVEFAPAIDPKDFLVEKVAVPEVPFGAGRWQRTLFLLRPVRGPGQLVLPPFVAKARDGSVSASTPEQHVNVRSAMGDASAAKALTQPV